MSIESDSSVQVAFPGTRLADLLAAQDLRPLGFVEEPETASCPGSGQDLLAGDDVELQ